MQISQQFSLFNDMEMSGAVFCSLALFQNC